MAYDSNTHSKRLSSPRKSDVRGGRTETHQPNASTIKLPNHDPTVAVRFLKQRILIASFAGQVRASRQEKRRHHEGVLGQRTGSRTNATLILGKIQQLYHYVNTHPTRVILSFWSPCLVLLLKMQIALQVLRPRLRCKPK
jgi:hypothetical protein